MERVYAIAAAVTAIFHLGLIVFEPAFLVLVFKGRSRGWRWTRNVWLRSMHIGVILIVVIESWFQLPCPVTVWEGWFRELAGQPVEPGEFVSCWTQHLYGFETPPWILTVIYTLFGAVVVWAWWHVPPCLPWRPVEQPDTPDNLSVVAAAPPIPLP